MTLAALTISNVITNRWLPPRAYVPWNLALAGGLVGLARASGHSLDDLGLDPSRLTRGARLGSIGSLAVGVGYAALLGSGRAHTLLEDHRITALSTQGTLWHLLVQIPFGTVLAEEVVFRGVLPPLFQGPRRPSWAPSTVASLLFGLWHVLPARQEATAKGAPVGARTAVTLVSTALGGGLLHRFRVRAGHVAAPIALHFATNGLGLLAVRIAAARR